MSENPLLVLSCDGNYVTWRKASGQKIETDRKATLEGKLQWTQHPNNPDGLVRIGVYICDETDVETLIRAFKEKK